MGHMRSIQMAGAVAEGLMSLDRALEDQVYCNHFPPCPVPAEVMIPLVKAAIQAGVDEEPDRVLRAALPDGETKDIPAYQLIECEHLEEFIELARVMPEVMES